jgi:hypothetical protein
LRPAQRKQKGIKEKRKNDNRDAVIMRVIIDKSQRVKNRDGKRFNEPSNDAIIAEID